MEGDRFAFIMLLLSLSPGCNRRQVQELSFSNFLERHKTFIHQLITKGWVRLLESVNSRFYRPNQNVYKQRCSVSTIIVICRILYGDSGSSCKSQGIGNAPFLTVCGKKSSVARYLCLSGIPRVSVEILTCFGSDIMYLLW